MSLYQSFGVDPIINACGSVTRLGGAPMSPEVLKAFQEAASEWVPLEQLQAAASKKIAAHTGAEAGLVTSGAAGALTLGTAAILAGHNMRRIEQLPHCDEFPHEFIIAREQRSGYDHAVRAAGARLVEVGFNEIVSNAGVRRTESWEYAAAITENTAGIVYVHAADSQPALPEVVEVARQHQLPVLVDAAGELPPRDNLKAILATGADLVVFSGGKAIRGPQSTGLLCGKRELISSAALQMLDMDDHFELWQPPADLIDTSLFQGLPRHGIGRALKVSKEEIIALLTALELFASGAYDEQNQEFQSWLEMIGEELELAQVHATCYLATPVSNERWPLLDIHIDEEAVGTAFKVCQRLRQGTPPIYVGHAGLHEGMLTINPLCLTAQDARTLAVRLCEELK
ncbi:aminotransferase class V-fold PLP-dependent enzyme [Gimesia fumaroli]|uniref:L-seryl-tRNA(Sec) selenium transferase n=1 Tax=Gimesia fumaroli TaxID=2527976 RepID=A0A518I9A9_9PLAN|nr:aminotransferase class V-fold PLP-dependent enzyme [Gimesia fumaroli]QDV49644.1 L-seryl-tRNA(Sec) selenium transferase [Gimesia fumaroli]